MRHIVFFLLTTVFNIGSLESRQKIVHGRTRLVFENDYVAFRCSVNISANPNKYPALWWRDVNGMWLVVASVFRSITAKDQTITRYGFKVTQESDLRSKHLIAGVKTQCTHTGYYTCNKQKKKWRLLLVIKSVPKPTLSVYYYYCYEVHDPRCESCWRTSRRVVKYNEPTTINCTAKIAFPFDYEVGFEWYYKIDNKPQDCWHRIRSNVPAEWVAGRRHKYRPNQTYCLPLIEKTSTLVFSPPTESDMYTVKCEVHFRVGYLVKISAATVSFCALGRASGPIPLAKVSSSGNGSRTSDPNSRPKPISSGNKDKVEDGNSTHLVIKRYVLENETVKILCYQAFTKGGELTLSVRLPQGMHRWKTVAMAGNPETYNNKIWEADGFSVSPASNSSYLYVETKARCNLTGLYKCSHSGNNTKSLYRRVEVIKVPPPTLYPFREIGCDNFIDQRCDTCKKDGYIVRNYTETTKIACAARMPILMGSAITFEWYYRIEGKACWNRIMRNISAQRMWHDHSPFYPGQCAGEQLINSVLSFSPSEDKMRFELKCIVNNRQETVVNFRQRQRLVTHQTVQATVKICFLDRRKRRLRPTIDAIQQKVFENDPARFSCFMKGPFYLQTKIGLSVSPNGIELSRSVASVQINFTSYKPLERNSRFTVREANFSYLATEIERVQCKDTNNYLCEFKTDGQPTVKSAILRFEVMRRFTRPTLLVRQATLCDGGPLSLCSYCNSRVPVRAFTSGFVKITCFSDVPPAEGVTFWFKWYYREQNGKWRSGTKYSRTKKDWSSVISKPGTCALRKRMWSTLHMPRQKNDIVEVKCRIQFRFKNTVDSLAESLEICVLDPPLISMVKGAGTKAGNVGMIVGIVASVMAVIAGVVLIISYTQRRRQNTEDADENSRGPDVSDVNHSEYRQRRNGENVAPRVSKRMSKNVAPSGFRKKRTGKKVTSTFSSKSRSSKRSTCI